MTTRRLLVLVGVAIALGLLAAATLAAAAYQLGRYVERSEQLVEPIAANLALAHQVVAEADTAAAQVAAVCWAPPGTPTEEEVVE